MNFGLKKEKRTKYAPTSIVSMTHTHTHAIIASNFSPIASSLPRTR